MIKESRPSGAGFASTCLFSHLSSIQSLRATSSSRHLRPSAVRLPLRSRNQRSPPHTTFQLLEPQPTSSSNVEAFLISPAFLHTLDLPPRYCQIEVPRWPFCSSHGLHYRPGDLSAVADVAADLAIASYLSYGIFPATTRLLCIQISDFGATIHRLT
jgi:hypothetical protein